MMTRALRITFRIGGVAFSAASIAGSAFVIAKLRTGRGADTPISAGLHEQPLIAILGLAGVALGFCIALYPEEFVAARRWLNLAWVWRERKAEAALLALSTLMGILLLEAGSRALYARDEKFPFFYPPEHLIYPPLYHALRDYDPQARNVLMLGGSVMNGAGRGGRLQAMLGPPWRVYNLAQNAQCSLDSLTKYRWLIEHGYRFDYVLLYEAINETRQNNAPPEVFRTDYSHYLFYRLVHAVFGDDRPVWRAALHSALVYRFDRLITQLRETRAFGRKFVNISYPRKDWLPYGAEIRSAPSYERNVLAIAELARRSGAALIGAEFAYDPCLDAYVRSDSGAPSREWMIDYTREWGLPENVQKGIVIHNQMLRKHADILRVVSTDSLRDRAIFADPCHFTPEGELVFIRFWADTLQQ